MYNQFPPGLPKYLESVKVNIGFPVVRGSVYGHVITKFSGMGRFTKLWGSAHARAKRARGAPLKKDLTKKI